MEGYPLQIIIKNKETNSFELKEEALASVLLSKEVADKHVCVLAVAGAFRKGKSFLLNFLLQYCDHKGYQNSNDWLRDETRPLQGFKWSRSHQRETTGILIWSKPFIMKTPSGEQVAVVLMDTQGTFDTESPTKDSALVFALTLLVSSVVVYNLTSNIQEDDLMNLQTFASCGVQAQDDTDNPIAFQKLVFLVRDWGFASKTPYGMEGGQQVLDSVLEVKKEQHPAHQDVRRDVRKCFEDLSCYLMPHVGLEALDKEDFDGRISDLSKKFVEHLRLLVPGLLAPNNLVKKKLGKQPIQAKELFDFFKTSMETLKNMDSLDYTTFVEISARSSSQKALEVGKDVYMSTMDALVREQSANIVDRLDEEHEKVKQKAIASFLQENKYGRKNRRVSEAYQTKLESELNHVFKSHFAPLASSMAAKEAGLKGYEKAMKGRLAGSSLTASEFETAHREEMNNALRVYLKCNSYGKNNFKFFKDFQDQMREAVERFKCSCQDINAAKLKKKDVFIAAAGGAAGGAAIGVAVGAAITVLAVNPAVAASGITDAAAASGIADVASTAIADSAASLAPIAGAIIKAAVGRGLQ